VRACRRPCSLVACAFLLRQTSSSASTALHSRISVHFWAPGTWLPSGEASSCTPTILL